MQRRCSLCPLLTWCTAPSKGACNRGIKTRPSLLLEAGLPAQARRHFLPHRQSLSMLAAFKVSTDASAKEPWMYAM